MQDDQTSLVRLETGDNDQKKEMYQESIYEGIDQRRTIFHISIQLDMFLQLEDCKNPLLVIRINTGLLPFHICFTLQAPSFIYSLCTGQTASMAKKKS